MILILGAQGVGKTTIGKALAKKINYKYVNFGDLFQKEVKINRDLFRRNSNLKDFKKIQKKVITELSKMKGNIILTSHALLTRKDGLYPGFPFEMLKKLKLENIIFLYSNPKDIKKRRKKDKRKGRDVSSIDEINFEQKLAEHAAMIYSIISGVPVAFVENKEGKVDETIDKIFEMIK